MTSCFFREYYKIVQNLEMLQIPTSHYIGFTIQPRRIKMLYIMKPQTHKISLGTEFEARAKHRFGLSALLKQVFFLRSRYRAS